MISTVVFFALAVVSARFTFESGGAVVRSRFDYSAVGRLLEGLGALAMMAGTVWAFLVTEWWGVLIDLATGVVAGAVLFVFLQAMRSRGFWVLVANLGLIVMVVLMYGSHWHWFEFPMISRRFF